MKSVISMRALLIKDITDRTSSTLKVLYRISQSIISKQLFAM